MAQQRADFLIGSAAELPSACMEALARYRYRVFVEHLGWQLDTPPGTEQDAFDRPDTVHVVARRADGRIAGCARLLPTTRPYLLSHVFPALLHGRKAPASPSVWELSRFAALDPDGPRAGPEGVMSSPAAVRLLRAALRAAHERGAHELVTVSPQGVERLLRQAGFECALWGPPQRQGEHVLVACRIAVRSEDLVAIP